MYLKVSDSRIISTEGLRAVELNQENSRIEFTFDNAEEIQIPLSLKEVSFHTPISMRGDSDYEEFVKKVYANCYFTIIMAELSRKTNINSSFDYILLDSDFLVSHEEYKNKCEQITKKETFLRTNDEVQRFMLADIIDDFMNYVLEDCLDD